MADFTVTNKKLFDQKLKKIQEDGLEKLQIISDFDRTLTKAFSEEGKIMSIWKYLEKSNYLGDEYGIETEKKFNKYYPQEHNTDLTKEGRAKILDQWWSEVNELLIKYKFSEDIVKRIAQNDLSIFRDYFGEFISYLNQNEIPLLIFSAGIGNIIREMIKHHYSYADFDLISNFFKFNDDGYAIEYSKPVINSANKDHISMKEDIVKKRHGKTNLILMGDSLDDPEMAKNIHYENILLIGFLNDKVDYLKEKYNQIYDVVITGDPSLEWVVNLIKSLESNL